MKYTRYNLGISANPGSVTIGTAKGVIHTDKNGILVLFDEVAHLIDHDFYWSFYVNDGFFDAEFNSRDEAYDHADGMFSQECEDDDVRSDASRVIKLVQFYTDDEGERKEVRTEETAVEFEYYQGDHAEHNTYHPGGAV